MIKGTILKRFTQLFDSIYIARNDPGIHVILIKHKRYDHLRYDVIEYLNNNNKMRYYDISLYIGKWLKDQFETPKERYMKSIDGNLFILNTKNKISPMQMLIQLIRIKL